MLLYQKNLYTIITRQSGLVNRYKADTSLYHKSSRRKPTRRYAVLCLLTKGFDDKMFSDRRVPANRAFARDNPLMRIICLRLLYHKSSRRKPTRRYAVLCLLTKGFDDKMFSDRRVPANRAFARDNPLMRIICLRLLYHDC